MLSKLTPVVGCAALALLFMQPGFARYKSSSKNTESFTGCVIQGSKPNAYALKAEDGQTYDLRSSTVNIGEHLNHKVTVTGKVSKEKETAAKVNAKTGTTEENSRMRVSSLKMVSTTCQ